MLDSLVLLATSAGGAAAAAGVGWALYTRWYVAVPPNRALVLYGRGAPPASRDRPVTHETVDLRQARIVVGGGAFVPPWNKGVGRLSLDPGPVEVAVRAFSALDSGRATGWEVSLQVQVHIPNEAASLERAAQGLLGKSEEEVRSLVRSTVAAVVPSLLSRLRPEGGEPNWDRLAADIQASVAPDLLGWGFLVRTLAVTDLRRLLPADAPAMLPTKRPSLAPGLAEINGRTVTEAGALEIRLARLERSLGLASVAIARLYEEAALGRGDPGSVFDAPLGSELPSGTVAGNRPLGSRHESTEVRRPRAPILPPYENTEGERGGAEGTSVE